ncbi:hypothetical protein LCGC14_1653470 [marine sediment metagenome]|uniref:Uncharacterized protein n=1 Tax=marine sediment metagenome TaxID=412755 RepID=A0A0F9HWX2_9ZZZZ
MPEKKYPKITKKDLGDGVKKWKKENEWEEEFEDECGHCYCETADAVYLKLIKSDKWLENLIEDCIGETDWNNTIKVKIKTRKGKIVIERIEE